MPMRKNRREVNSEGGVGKEVPTETLSERAQTEKSKDL